MMGNICPVIYSCRLSVVLVESFMDGPAVKEAFVRRRMKSIASAKRLGPGQRHADF